MSNLSLLDLSENTFPISSTRGDFFIYNNNLYIVYVEQDKIIKIKTGSTTYIINDGSLGSDDFVIYDIYLYSNLLYICGSYGTNGFCLSYNLNLFSLGSFTTISDVDLISHIFVLNNNIHLLYRTASTLGLYASYSGSLSNIVILNNLTSQKNAYIRDYLYDGGNLYIFVQQEDDTTSYINLRVFYHSNYNATNNFDPSNSILLKTNNKHTLFSSISQINGSKYLFTIVEDFITDISSVQQNTLYSYNINTFISNPNHSNSLSLNGISIYGLESIEYNGLIYLFGFCYQGTYETPKYLVVLLESMNNWNPQYITKSSSMGYISTNHSVEIINYQNKVYLYLETRLLDPETQILGDTRVMISDFIFPETLLTISNGFISPLSLLSYESGTIFDFMDPELGIDVSCGIYYGEGQLDLGLLGLNGPRVSIQNATLDKKFIFGSISTSLKNSLNIYDNFVMILKVVDASSGQIIQNLNPNLMIDIYLDSSSGSIIRLKVNGDNAGSGTLVGQTVINGVTKYKYTSTLTKGNGAVRGNLFNPAGSVGSDPHITTIFGTKYDFHPSSRKTYTLFKSKDIKIKSHFTGFKTGVFYDKVNIELKNKEKLDIDFNKKKIKGESKLLKVIEDQPLTVKYKNLTNDKSVGDYFEPKKLTKILYQGKNPMEMYVDFKTRYVHFRFPETLPPVNEISGLIVKEANRLE
jgi:hypothetical protein